MMTDCACSDLRGSHKPKAFFHVTIMAPQPRQLGEVHRHAAGLVLAEHGQLAALARSLAVVEKLLLY
jgi:hypothetical protein